MSEALALPWIPLSFRPECRGVSLACIGRLIYWLKAFICRLKNLDVAQPLSRQSGTESKGSGWPILNPNLLRLCTAFVFPSTRTIDIIERGETHTTFPSSEVKPLIARLS